MAVTIVAFLIGCALVLGGVAAIRRWADVAAGRQVSRRLQQGPEPDKESASDVSLVKQEAPGVVMAFDRSLAGTRVGPRLGRLVEQSGVATTPGRVVMISFGAGIACALLASVFARQWLFTPMAFGLGAAAPFWWLLHRRTKRWKRFEEQFPEVLELLSRAIRAGHAFQTALGMAATELKPPAGAEFKRTFDEQNFGLPLRDALAGLSERVPLLDVRFFVTAVMIQRETGGNLAEILDNLAAVVRERFKIRRQIRIHSAHGRFTGYVLLGLPAFLAVALSIINPEHMGLLFREHMGQIMLGGAMVMQVVGYFWIRQVIRIEV